MTDTLSGPATAVAARVHDVETQMAAADTHIEAGLRILSDLHRTAPLFPARITARDVSIVVRDLEDALLRLRHGTPR